MERLAGAVFFSYDEPEIGILKRKLNLHICIPDPLKLRKFNDHSAKEAPYLTKYVIQPDPAFQAR